jgi:hypothetical protein
MSFKGYSSDAWLLLMQMLLVRQLLYQLQQNPFNTGQVQEGEDAVPMVRLLH